MRLLPRHLPALRKPHIHAEEALAAEIVPLTGFTGEGLTERARVIRKVGKDVHFTYVGRVIVRTSFYPSDLIAISREVPICRPLKSVADAEGKAARQTADAESCQPPITASRALFAFRARV